MSELAYQAMRLSLQVAGLTLLIATPMAVLLATVMARTRWRGKLMMDSLVLLPMGLPPTLIGIGLLFGLGPHGEPAAWLRDTIGADLDFFPGGLVLATTLMTLPMMVRLLRPAFEATDPMLLAVARSLGASRWQAWRTITLPMAAPSVASAMALGLACAWGEAGATLVLAASLQSRVEGMPALPLALIQALKAPDDAGSAWLVASMSIGVALLAVMGSEWARTRWRRQWQTRLRTRPQTGKTG